jgi:hypothetical protein
MQLANTTGMLSISNSPNTSTQRLVEVDSRPLPARGRSTEQSVSWVLMKMRSEGCWRAASLRDVSSCLQGFAAVDSGTRGSTPACTGSVCP